MNLSERILEERASNWGRDWKIGRKHIAREVRKLEDREASARAIMEKFVNKVDSGMARSKETYAEMKEWLKEK